MKILLVGCGKMGGAMMAGWLKSGVSLDNITVVDPLYEGRNAFKTLAELPAGFKTDFVVLAVKPQNIDDVAAELKKFSDSVFISIIAGKKIDYFKKYLPKSYFVRTMPNLPSLIGKGVTAAISSQPLSEQIQASVEQLLKPCGKLIWLKDENLMDAVTAISGSGPAYVFLFAQSLIEAATGLGLDEETAKSLVFGTIRGSIKLAEKSGDNLATLKQNVTSKGGTTEAALAILEENDKLKKLIISAANQAKQRSSELSSQ